MGKAILAMLPEDERDDLLDRIALISHTEATIVEREALLADLRRTQVRGYAIDDREGSLDVRCVGAPVYDHSGRPFAALSVSGPAYRLTMERIEAISGQVSQTAAEISQRLGYVTDPARS